MTWSPAPIANRSSVAVGESDTMRSGLAWIVTSPLVPETVTGKAAAAELTVAAFDEAGSSEPQAASANASATATMMPRGLPWRPPVDRKALRWVSFSPPTNRPSVEDRRLRHGTGDPTRPRKGLDGCGTVPDSNRSSLHPVAPGLPRPDMRVVPPAAEVDQST